MPENITINVSPQTSASVDVRADNVASYYYELAKQWAISPDLVEQLDYSSKYYANKSEEAADSILTDAGFIAVSQDLTNIDTVANSITNVNAVANDVTNINLVADDLTNIDSVADDLTNIDSVADDLVNINAVNNNKTNIDTVAENITKINGVYNDLTKVNAVYADLTNIDSVAGDLTNIDIVASAKTNIDTNATYISNINTVAGSISNVNAVASDLINVNAVANDLTNIGTVASNITDVNTCATNISNINTCAANILIIADKVSKTGDTMTGDLTIQKSTYTTYSSSYDEGGRLFVKDKNDNNVGTFAIFSNTFHNHAEMSLYDGNSSSAWFGIKKTSASNSDEVYASSGVKQSITNWAFPSTTYTDLRSHWGASGFTVTAPANGWVYLDIQNSGNAFGLLNNITKGFIQISNPSANYGIFVNVPATKGDVIEVQYNTTSALNEFRFIHAIGG